jgi:glutamine synthetase
MDTGPALNLDQLRNGVQAERFDTVLLAFGDMQGRLQGKRIVAQHFLDSVVEHGYGEFALSPDLETLRPIPWHEKTALCIGDLRTPDGSPVVASPRRILQAQLERLAERGLEADTGTELEFIIFKNTYEEARENGYRELTPVNRYDVDASLLGAARVEKLIGRLRREMATAGMEIESSGQHAINFKSGPALRTADDHVIYKNGAKEIASLEEMAITFMASYDERAGSSCHIQLSLRDGQGAVFARDPGLLERWIAGQLACLRELTLFYAPNINSYKRFAKGSFAPTTVAWGRDNRTCAVRVVGHGDSLRMELRVPGADVNPYLALAAMIAAGLHGLDNELELEPALEGNAYVSHKPTLPSTLTAACDLFGTSKMAVAAFGEEVVARYLDNARVELEAFEAAVTDWERVRGFERL